MNLQYEEVYSTFLQKITDYSFLEYDEQFVYDQMKSWLRSGSANPRIKGKFNKIIFDDEIMKIEFDLKHPVDDESDIDFVKEVLSRSMLIEWIEPQVNNVLLTKQFFGGKEEKFYSQQQHLTQMQNLLDNTRIELQKYLRDYGYIHNSYIEE